MAPPPGQPGGGFSFVGQQADRQQVEHGSLPIA